MTEQEEKHLRESISQGLTLQDPDGTLVDIGLGVRTALFLAALGALVFGDIRDDHWCNGYHQNPTPSHQADPSNQ